MTIQWRFLPILLLVLTVVVSLMGCERGPQGEQGATGPPGQPGEVITVTTPPPDVAPLPSETGLTTRQAQPRVHFDPAALPAGVPQVEVVPGSPARVTVAFTLTDDTGTPIDRSVLDALRFTLSHLDVEPQTGLTHWVSDILRTQRSTITSITVTQPNDENNTPTSSTGTFTALGNGVYRYTFAARLPEGFDPTKTYRIGVQARRTPVPGRSFVDNATLDFRPDGGPRLATRDVVQTENCQRCHEPFAFHGGIRTEVKVCVQCHTPQNTDPDTLDPIPGNPANPFFDPINPAKPLPNPLNLNILIHRIHFGSHLKNVDDITFEVIGFNQTVFDFSAVEFPQDIRNCTVCHTGTTEANNHRTAPHRAACGACHAREWFGDPAATPPNLQPHPGGPQPDDTQCTSCHIAEGPAEFDLSIRGAHTNPQRSVQAPGVKFTIVHVEDATDGDQRVDPGHAVRVIFNVQTNAGQAILPRAMANLRLVLAGPTTDYRLQDYNGDGQKKPGDIPPGESHAEADARNASGPDAAGNFSLTFSNPIPKNAVGTYAVGIEGFMCVKIAGLNQQRGGRNCTTGNTAFDEIREVGPNVVAYFAVTDTTPLPRRTVVSSATRCVACHGEFSKDFSVHGGIRNATEHCVLCHNPSFDSLGRQPAPAAGTTAETFPVNFKALIHKIHRGPDLTEPYLLFAPDGTATNVQELLFPGDLRHCQKCHVTDAAGNRTELLIPDKGVLGPDVQPTEHHRIDAKKTILETIATLPITSACTSCHDTPVTAAHVQLNTLGGVETCTICHGDGRDFAVDKVHAR
jgi:OmcA/MtrC family decaheme c-type cytochrome